jgi:ribosomal-protein-alanine N-acetyltransferase
MIREARAPDLPALLAIQSAALEEPWPALLRASIDGPSLVLVLADADDAPVAYALVVAGEQMASVAELAVAPPAQAEGRGSRLLDALLERLRDDGIETVRLTTRAEDRRLRAFYAEHGFVVRERISDHYEDGDGVVLELRLRDRFDGPGPADG